MSLFLFNDTAPPEIYPLSLHDALPISGNHAPRIGGHSGASGAGRKPRNGSPLPDVPAASLCGELQHQSLDESGKRSEEHTSELQSHVNLVCRLLLEKKKKKYK